MFANSSKIWNWLVRSSENPQVVAMTAKGALLWAIPNVIQSLFTIFNIHPGFDLNNVPDAVYTIVYTTLNALGFAITSVGILRKAWNSVFPPK